MPIVHISEFTALVMKLVKSIPPGKVATYKQIAELAGKPQGSRGVGWILNSCARKYQLPWQRVLNSKGEISFEPGTSRFRSQRRLLLGEGVAMDTDGKLELAKYQWKKKPKQKRGAPSMFSKKV